MRTIVLLVFITFHSVAFSAVINVPVDYTTIQLAIDAAVDGDTVLVAPGTYVENIDFLGKAVTVQALNGPGVTVIDGNEKGSVVTFNQGEGHDSVLNGFTVTNGSGTYLDPAYTYGGGILCDTASPTLTKNVITLNHSVYGAGIYCLNSSALIIENQITSNQFGEKWISCAGGGILCDSASPLIENNIIHGNTNAPSLHSTRGGGIACYDNSEPDIVMNLIQDNKTGDSGGGIYSFLSAPLIRHNIIMGNNCANSGSGGGINISYCSGIVADNVIVGNLAEYGDGGGIYCRNHEGDVENNTIIQNSSLYGRGGGIVCEGNFIGTLKSNIICENSAEYGGGGILCSFTTAGMINNVICNNKTMDLGGGGIRWEGSYCPDIFIHNTICGNSAREGGGIYVSGVPYVDIGNSIIWNNSAPVGPQFCLRFWQTPVFLNIYYSDVQGGQSGVFLEPGCVFNMSAGMIDADPLFVEPVEGDFHLEYTSPCRNTGYGPMPNLPAEDFEGDPRIAYGNVDMGADEFHTHLYYTGNATPGGNVKLKYVGLPGTMPVGLCVGTGVLDPPIPSMWGDWYLELPIFGPIILPSLIPSTGVLIIPGNIPPTLPAFYSIPMQALIGDALSNLLCLVVN